MMGALTQTRISKADGFDSRSAAVLAFNLVDVPISKITVRSPMPETPCATPD